MKMEPFALERWMTTWETRVQYDLAESGIHPLRARDLLDLLPDAERASALHALLDLRLGYSEARGTEALRGLLAATYRDAAPDEILVTTGAIEANFLLFQLLLEPGDHVVACYPAYQQLYSVPRGLGCEVAYWRAREEDGFRFDVDDLARLVTRKTRLIVLNTPHNPTGAALSDADVRRVYALADAAGATVLSDEAYRWLDVPGGSRRRRRCSISGRGASAWARSRSRSACRGCGSDGWPRTATSGRAAGRSGTTSRSAPDG